MEEGIIGLVGGAEEEGVRWGGSDEGSEGVVVYLDQEFVFGGGGWAGLYQRGPWMWGEGGTLDCAITFGHAINYL